MNQSPSSRLALLRNNGLLSANYTGLSDEISTNLATQEAAAALPSVQQQLGEVESQKQLSQSVLASTVPLAPIHRLPAELLVQIYRQHWIEFDEIYDCKAFDPVHANAPSLCDLARDCNGHTCAVGGTAIQRSRDVPLSVSIFNDRRWNPMPFPDMAVLRLLATTSQRWRSAQLWCLPEDVPCLDAGLPLLESVQARSNTFHGLPAMPRLRSITYDGFQNVRDLPLEQLQSIQIKEFPYSQLKTLLAILPRLHGCVEISMTSADSASPDTGPTAITPPIVCGAEELRLSLPEDAYFADALQLLTADLTTPRLRKLVLKSDLAVDGFLRWPHETFLRYMTRSNLHGQLVTLNLADVLISAHELAEVLRETAALEFLEFRDDDEQLDPALDVPLLNELLEMNDDNSPKLLPRLQELWYSSCCTNKFDHDLFLSFVEARVALLPRFHLTLAWSELYGPPNARFTPEILRRFGALQKEPRPSVAFSLIPYEDGGYQSDATCELCCNYQGPYY